jgi:hypothetical protein
MAATGGRLPVACGRAVGVGGASARYGPGRAGDANDGAARLPGVGAERGRGGVAVAAPHPAVVAESLRSVLSAIDSGDVVADDVQRAYLAGALDVLDALGVACSNADATHSVHQSGPAVRSSPAPVWTRSAPRWRPKRPGAAGSWTSSPTPGCRART